MKNALYLVILILWILLLAKLTNAEERGTFMNRQACAIGGKQEDCKTPATIEQIQCDNFYNKGFCDANGEVYEEYSQDAVKLQVTREAQHKVLDK